MNQAIYKKMHNIFFFFQINNGMKTEISMFDFNIFPNSHTLSNNSAAQLTLMIG